MFYSYTYPVFLHLVHKADIVLTTICRLFVIPHSAIKFSAFKLLTEKLDFQLIFSLCKQHQTVQNYFQLVKNSEDLCCLYSIMCMNAVCIPQIVYRKYFLPSLAPFHHLSLPWNTKEHRREDND